MLQTGTHFPERKEKPKKEMSGLELYQKEGKTLYQNKMQRTTFVPYILKTEENRNTYTLHVNPVPTLFM